MLKLLKKKIFAIGLATMMLVTIIAPKNVIAAKPEMDVLTVDRYEEYLKSTSLEDYQKFINLTQDEKQQFVDVLQDPKIYSNNDSSENIVKKSYKNISFDSPVRVKRASTIRSTWGTSTVSIFGIEVLKYKIEAGYKVSRNRIRSIVYYDAYVVKNLNPMVQTSTQGKYSYISKCNNYPPYSLIWKHP